MIATQNVDGLIDLLTKFFGITLGLTCFGYIYFGVVLMMLAAKTSTPNGFLAWIPIGNVFLLCNIARRSPATFLLLLIPIVNIIVGAMLWMSVAENRGKPSWLGALVFLPVIGLLVPLILLAGPKTNPDEVGASATLCPSCGASAQPGEAFCGECGSALPQPVRSGTRRTSAVQLAAVGTVIAAVSIGGTGVASWMLLGNMLSYQRPDLKAPLVAKRMAGVMKEFPIDTDSNPAKPESMIAESYDSGSSDVKIADKWVPKGIDKATLPKKVRTLSAANYRRKGAASPVQVSVMEPQPGVRDLGKTLSANIGDAPGAKQSGITVENSDGTTYTGTRTQTSTEETYVLENDGTGTTIVVTATNPSEWDTADRLAQNVGNGDGLLESPTDENVNPVFLLPAELPAGMELVAMESMTVDDLLSTEDVKSIEAEAASNREIAEAWKAFRAILPERWTVATYRDGGGKEWKAGVLDYADSRKCWLVWQFFKTALTGQGLARIDVNGAEGHRGKADGKGWMYFQRGPFLAVVEAPGDASDEAVDRLGRSIQI
ncbi:MAG TPA: DUF5684 domain-containing protein [Fimbriimonadaceae bacterium]|nr:DUF5684 domain-containing protein [Fimbriimonadaceae bacterium]